MLNRTPYLSLSLAIVLLLAPGASAQELNPRSRITTATGVRVRQAPRTDAAEVARLPLGVVVFEMERSARRERVGGVEDYWYRVAAPDAISGWVFGALTAEFDPARRGEGYHRLAASRLANADATFGELSDLVRFLERAVTEVKERGPLGELELTRLVALQRALANVDAAQADKPPYAAWTKARESQLVFSEPAGQWFVRADLFWDLQKKYRTMPALAERIAWEAAQVPLPGECEGYLPCHLYALSQSEGRYLRLYPRGANARAALDKIGAFLADVVEDARRPQPVFAVAREDRAEFAKALAELRAQIAQAAHPLRARVLAQLDEIAARYR